MKGFIIILSLTILSCGKQRNTFTIQNQLDTQTWNLVTDLEIAVLNPFLYEGDKELFISFKDLDNNIVGLASSNENNCVIQLDSNWIDTDYYKSILYHEIGHCLGFGHDNNPESIMYPYVHLVSDEYYDKFIDKVKTAIDNEYVKESDSYKPIVSSYSGRSLDLVPID